MSTIHTKNFRTWKQIMAFQDNNPVRLMLIVNNESIEQDSFCVYEMKAEWDCETAHKAIWWGIKRWETACAYVPLISKFKIKRSVETITMKYEG